MTDKNMTNFLKIRQILAVIILATKVGINHILMIIKVNIILFNMNNCTLTKLNQRWSYAERLATCHPQAALKLTDSDHIACNTNIIWLRVIHIANPK